MTNEETMTVTRIEDGRDDPLWPHWLLWGIPTNGRGVEYPVIAETDSTVEVGDVIRYEPYGANGFLIDIQAKKRRSQ